MADVEHVAFDGIARGHGALMKGAEVVHHRGDACRGMGGAKLRDHFKTLVVKHRVAI